MNDLGGYHIEDLMVGMSATVSRQISERDIFLFAGASGDRNPVHLDEEYARGTRFGGRIAHGMLTASLISATIAGRLPGPGSVYVSQSLKFIRPVRPGDIVTTTVTIEQVMHDKRLAALRTVCRVDDRVVIEGDAVVSLTSVFGHAKSEVARSETLS